MAGDDELQMILSGISAGPPVTNDDINNILFSTDINGSYNDYTNGSQIYGDQFGSLPGQDMMVDPVTQLLSHDTPSYYQPKQRTVSLSVASPESGIDLDSPYTDPASVSPVSHDSMTVDMPLVNGSARSLSNRIAFSSGSDTYNYQQQPQLNMAMMLQQLTNESNELLADSENDLSRLKHVTHNYRNSVISQPQQRQPVMANNNVFITGPNHRGTDYTQQQHQPQHYQQQPQQTSVIQKASVIVKNVQPQSPPQQQKQPENIVNNIFSVNPQPQQQMTEIPQVTYTNENYSVDFSSVAPIVINVPQSRDVIGAPIVVETIDDDNDALDVDTKEDVDIFKNFEIAPKKDSDDYLCYVCGEKAGKHSYYGGQVCASCRAFFRRSVQSKYYEIFQCKFDKHCKITSQTRKTCQFCRFKKCLEAGMKPSWVLSDEERNRRFNKFNKLQQKSAATDKTISRKTSIRVPELYITFTMEEQKLLEFIKNKFNFCHKSWLRNLLMFDRSAGINFIEASYKLAPLHNSSFRTMQRSCHVYFTSNILPNFIQLETMSPEDQAAVLHGRNSNMSHFFKMSQCLKIKRPQPMTVVKNEQEMCPIQRQVAEIANNNDMMETLDLTHVMSKLQMGYSPQFPTYQEMFPAGWTREEDDTAESRHAYIMRQIQSWPFDEQGQFDHAMMLLMCLMLLFHPDPERYVRSDQVEKVQVKYSTLLQRYLKSKMSVKAANKKFLDAIMLLSHTNEMWDINEKYMK